MDSVGYTVWNTMRKHPAMTLLPPNIYLPRAAYFLVALYLFFINNYGKKKRAYR